jgi:putative nucleotidyltransferase with HDIG domain
MALKEVPTSQLQVGMYVAALDRPWLETPFLFQGFPIRSERELEELARYCETVQIDDAAKPVPGGSAGNGASSASGVAAGPVPGTFYSDSASTADEAPRAQAAWEQANGTVAQVLRSVRSGGRLDVEMLDGVVEPMMESVLRNQDAIVWLSRIREADDYTCDHAVTCSIYAIAFGRHLGLPHDDLQVLGLGALLFDIGKTRLPPALLEKPGALTEDEQALMRSHVDVGVELLTGSGSVDERVLSMVRDHHERYDGSGYQRGLKGPDIPVFARIAGVVDFYTALTADRPWASAVSSYDAMRQLHRRSRGEFQPELVDNFVQAIGMFPNGALVELSSGEVAVVIQQNRVRRLRPRVLVLLDADKAPLAKLRTVDLKDYPAEPGVRGAVWIDRGLEPGAFGIDPADYFLS